VTDANALTRPVHDLMPALLCEKDIEPWLSGAAGTEVLRLVPEDALRFWPVLRAVNRTGERDDPRLIDDLCGELPPASNVRAIAGGS